MKCNILKCNTLNVTHWNVTHWNISMKFFPVYMFVYWAGCGTRLWATLKLCHVPRSTDGLHTAPKSSEAGHFLTNILVNHNDIKIMNNYPTWNTCTILELTTNVFMDNNSLNVFIMLVLYYNLV